jgi:hypothetical protein
MGKFRIAMFSWENLYSIRVGGISHPVSELSESLQWQDMKFIFLHDVAMTAMS